MIDTGNLVDCQTIEGYRNVFYEEVLKTHNKYRRRHGAPNLKLDAQLTSQSQQCAQDLLYTDNIRSSRFPSVGENIFVVTTNDPTYSPKGEDAVNDWYQQRDLMEIGQEPQNNNGVNFSQLVWKTTRLLGIGIARNNNKIVIVCQYMPPGNIYGEYVKNVLPAQQRCIENTRTNN